MTKDQKIGVMWKLLFGTVTCLAFALPVLSDSSKLTKTSCPGEFSQQSTLPTAYRCKMVRLPDGSMLQTVPKLFCPTAVVAGKNPGRHIICRIPDCGKNLCKNGWCEDTMGGYNCTCSSGFQGRHCDEKSVITEAKTKSEPSPTATMPERSDATTSQETTISKSAELSTTDAASKPTTSSTTTMSDTTTSTYSSPPVDCEFGGSFYNFSTAKMNHASAVSACSQYGSHLVFIESQEEQDFIAERASEEYWIGLTGSSLSEARWLDGSSLTYSHFTQYSFEENVNCFRIQVAVQYSWQDRDCSTQYRYICEK